MATKGKRQAIDIIGTEWSTAEIWQRTEYALTADGKKPASRRDTHLLRTYDDPTTVLGPAPAGLQAGADFRWNVDGAYKFDLRMDWYAGLLSGGKYEVYYREFGASNWVHYATRNFQASIGIFPQSGSDSYHVSLPHQGHWELRVYVSALGSLSSLTVASASAEATPSIWTAVDEAGTIEIEYDYYGASPTPELEHLLKEMRVLMETDPAVYHRTEYLYDSKYHAYVHEIHRSTDGLQSAGLVEKATYDAFGRVTSYTTEQGPIAFTRTYEYDAGGRLVAVHEPGVNEGGATKHYTYEWIYDDAVPSITQLIRDASDTTGANFYDKSILIFDSLGRLTQEQKIISGAVQAVRSLEYNQRSQVRKETLHGVNGHLRFLCFGHEKSSRQIQSIPLGHCRRSSRVRRQFAVQEASVDVECDSCRL